MTEATRVQWVIGDGEPVQAGQHLYTLGTDKVENEIEAPVDGVLRRIGEEGEVYPVGTQIGEIA